MSATAAVVSAPVHPDARSPGAAGDGCGQPSVDAQLRMLNRLAEAGLKIAVAIEESVAAGEGPRPLAELTAAAQAYDRTARAVRLAILLQSRLVKDRNDEAREARLERERRREARQRQVGRIVEWAAGEALPGDRQGAEHLVREARERLDEDDIYGDVLTRPVGELVAMVCRDLGVEVDWEALSDEAWAVAEIESGAPGSPFAGWASRVAAAERAVAGGPAGRPGQSP